MASQGREGIRPGSVRLRITPANDARAGYDRVCVEVLQRDGEWIELPEVSSVRIEANGNTPFLYATLDVLLANICEG